MNRALWLLACLLAACAGTDSDSSSDTRADPTAMALSRFRGLGVQLLPDLAPGATPTGAATGGQIQSFSARGAPLSDVLLSMFKDSDVNVMVDDRVAGVVTTFDIKSASLAEAFQVLLATHDVAYRWDGSFLHILPATRAVFNVDFPAGASQSDGGGGGGSAASDTSGGGGEGGGESGSTGGAGSGAAATAFWSTLRTDLETMTNGDDSLRLVTNASLGTVTVEGRPSSIRRVESYLSGVRRRATRLVSIEARILEVGLSRNFTLGVDWSLLPGFFNTNEQGTAGGGAVVSQGLSSAVDAIRFGLLKTDTFSLFVDALEAEGQVRVLSSPRVSTLNNVPAQIRVVEQVPVIEREIIDSEGTSRTQFSVRFEDAGVTVSVTPQIGDDGMITVHVIPSITEVSGFVTTPDNLISEPILNTRTVESILRIADGQAAVIGGLRSTRRGEELTKVPLLGDIPGLGALFRTTTQVREETELVIVLFPRILTPAWIDEDVERGLERAVYARKPFRISPIPMDEGAEAWHDFHLAGTPAGGDAIAPVLVAEPTTASTGGLRRRDLAQLAFARATDAARRGDESQAFADLSEALQLDSDDADAWLLKACLERRRNNSSAARRACERALGLRPDDPVARCTLALLDLHGGNPVAAEGGLRKALAGDATQIAALHNNLGVALLAQSRNVEAQAAFQEALGLDPELREAHLNLGVATDIEGDVVAASNAYRRYLLAGGDVADPRLRGLRKRIETLAQAAP